MNVERAGTAARTTDRVVGLLRSRDVRTAVIVFVVIRVVLGVWVWGVRQLYPVTLPPHPLWRPYLGVAVESNPILEPWQRWDTLHYQAIAERGYLAFDGALHIPFLYPFLMRWLGMALGGQTLLAGILISNLAFLVVLVGFYRLAVIEYGDHGTARRTLIYLASFPTAFFFLAAYAESLYLMAVILAFYALRRRKTWLAGFWGASAAMTRLPGILMALPLAYAGLRAGGQRARLGALGAAGLALLGGLIFPVYIWLGLDRSPLLLFREQRARYGVGFEIPGGNILAAVRQVIAGQSVFANSMELLFLLVFILLAVPVWRRLPRTYSVYYLATLALLLMRMGGAQPLLGTTRFVLTLFPAFLILADWGRNRWVHRVVMYLSWLGLLFLAGQFAIWGWVG